MRIIKTGTIPSSIKRITCNNCGTEFEFTKKECNTTNQLDVVINGFSPYNIECPLCNKTIYFDFK